jgi:hypothetical protein
MLVIRQILLLISTGIILAPHCNKLFAPIPASEPVPTSQQTAASVPVPVYDEIPVGEAVRQELFPRIQASEAIPVGVLGTTDEMESAQSGEFLWRQTVVFLGFGTITIIILLMVQHFLRRFRGREDETEEKRTEKLLQEVKTFFQQLTAAMELMEEMKGKYCSDFQNEMEDELSQPQTKLNCAGDGNFRD